MKHPSQNSSCTAANLSTPTPNPKYLTDKKFDWTEEQQGMLLGCFFYGYAASVGPFGLLADMIGARYLLFFSLAASSVCGLLYPLCADWGYGYLVAIRVLQGQHFRHGRTKINDESARPCSGWNFSSSNFHVGQMVTDQGANDSARNFWQHFASWKYIFKCFDRSDL